MALLEFAKDALSDLLLSPLLSIQFVALLGYAVLRFLRHAILCWILKLQAGMFLDVCARFGAQLTHLLES